MQTTYVFANPNKTWAEDEAVLRPADGKYIGRYSGETLTDYQAKDSDVVLMTLDEFAEALEKRLTTDPVEITEKDYWYYLEVLPPCSWHCGDSESFYMSEFISGRVTKHLVRLGKRYFSFDAPVMRNHHDRVKKVLDWMDKQEAEA